MQLVEPGPTGFTTKICDGLTGPVSVTVESSCQVIHGPGFPPGVVVPPATDGFSASLLVWMLSEGA